MDIAISYDDPERTISYTVRVRPVAKPYLFDMMSIIIEIRDLETGHAREV